LLRTNPRIAVLILIFLLLSPFLLRFALFLALPPGDSGNVQVVEFARGKTLSAFASDLEARKIITSARLFTIYARLRGADSKVQAGAYQLSGALSPGEILDKMVTGDVYQRLFAVPEGYSIYQVAELLHGKGFFDKEAFIRTCHDRNLLAELEIPAASVEGYLFPGTYNVLLGMTEAGLVREMVKKSHEVFRERFADRIKGFPLDRQKILTLASMIEKEAVEPSERPLIASVFLNRLRIKMPLQSDPTAVYGVRAFGGKVRKQDLLRNSPYNTYKIAGLPPGPIGNPGTAALEAVLNPAQSNYLYFVAKKDGTHFFSSTLAEHNRGVVKYLKSEGATVRPVAENHQ
jgi:UPF0755 protein